MKKKNQVMYIQDMRPSKKIYVVENSYHPNKDRTKYFVRASDIKYAHSEGERLFKGVSFTTREPNEDERKKTAHDLVIEAK